MTDPLEPLDFETSPDGPQTWEDTAPLPGRRFEVVGGLVFEYETPAKQYRLKLYGGPGDGMSSFRHTVPELLRFELPEQGPDGEVVYAEVLYTLRDEPGLLPWVRKYDYVTPNRRRA